MNFETVIQTVVADLDRCGIQYALIGGFAMAMRGVQRATTDLDFILALDDLSQADHLLHSHGYQRQYRSENVSHYTQDWTDIEMLLQTAAIQKADLNWALLQEYLEIFNLSNRAADLRSWYVGND